MDFPLISVIVPVYRVEQYLDVCVESIVRQTYHNLEIILVEDGSPDSCPAMCDAWARRDPRIRVVHKKNGGLSSARNAGLDVAQGEYIGFVDSDDYINENMYEILWSALSNSQKKMACCLSSRVYDDGGEQRLPDSAEKTVLNVEETLDAIFFGKAGTAVWRKLYARSVYEGIRFPEGETNEDYPLIVPTAVAADGMVFVKLPLYYYRVREGSITNVGYLTDARSNLVNRHLQEIKEQLREYGLDAAKSYGFFAAKNAYNIAITMEKNKEQLSPETRRSLGEYRKIMRQYLWNYAGCAYSTAKDKILYLLVLMQLLRPIYKLLNKK